MTYDLDQVTGPLGVGTNNLNLVRLLVDDDGDFKTGATLITPSAIDGGNNTVTFTVDFTDGQYYTLGSTEIAALPVTLLFFEANARDNERVVLDWATAEENGNAFFSIERSADGRNFEAIAALDGQGNSQAIVNYSYTDLNPLEGRSFYRLRQVDTNGEFDFSEIRSIQIQRTVEEVTFKAYPNPVTLGDELHLQYRTSHEQEVMIDVVSLNGVSMWSSEVTLQPGTQTLRLPTSRLSRGLNLLRIIDAQQKVVTLKVIVR